MGTSDTAAEILAAARTLIVAGGYDSFSYADIAKVVGIRNASIHHHFPSKAELVQVLVRRYREEAAAGMAALSASVPDALAQLRAYVDYWRRCILDGSAPLCICALLASQMPILPGTVALEVRAHFNALSAWLVQVLRAGMRQKSVHLTGTAAAEAEAFMATVHGAMFSARAYGDPAVFDTIVGPLLQRLGKPSQA
ncbi:TetR/AcrR family transcriptional regulator [Paracidovorax citrulli]|uniref:Transcriptional regulator, TetR family n=2 Tax=Paracidovorax citrulli TaxID=80869 RepID=A1TPI7_PARC0|nr:TetR/AcrR family transcriptional regulator [Paracidovorax citrulli]ABM32875.1 transcriptional regulator, TetR family [Paracidovorax citrulli AAC00-1]ATG93151.1 TetR/AcrR family transcriptional regulator [Paracidovorax citrulli]MVT29101.1 TetR family transcriptional regulator [Paracidovorax citrulli]MVT36823.1 TetR family transcriptional regulator [Paracidovorax citrulli]PVY67091.1 TetR family transcriptional regulator [Paracidovorax citrulli]